MSIYLQIADTVTALLNSEEVPQETMNIVVEALAETFEANDPSFDRVQFLSDCELAEGASA